MRLASKKFTFLLFLQIRSGTAVTVFRRSPLPLVSVFAGLVPGHRSSDEIKHDDTKYTRNGDADIVQRGGIHGCLTILLKPLSLKMTWPVIALAMSEAR